MPGPEALDRIGSHINIKRSGIKMTEVKTKDQIAAVYLADTKKKHGWKKLRENGRQATVIGYGPGNNIGKAVGDRLFRDGMSLRHPSLDQFDVTKSTNGREWLSESDVLVLCNGITHSNWFEDCSHDLIQTMFDVNVVGSLKVANSFVKETIDSGHKKYIVFVGSTAHKAVLNGSVAYCAAKSALAHATKCLAWELASKGFEVFAVHPSNTEGTPMTEKTISDLMRYRGMGREQAEAYWSANLPRTEWLQPEDIAETISFLVSGKADYMSGLNVDLSGGQR